MPFDQIHFGAGMRGIGAVLPLSLEAGGRVHVVVHAGSELVPDSELICSVSGQNGQRPSLVLDIASLSVANTIEQMDPQARAVLADVAELLVTTAITPRGIDAQSEFLVELARIRVKKDTIFILGEEDIGEEHTELVARLRTLGVDVRRSVLSRLCSPGLGATGKAQRVVCADESVEWFVEGKPSGPMLRSLSAVTGVAFTERIEEHALRIRWLVQGIRLALALLAAEANQSQLRMQAAERVNDGWLETVYSDFVPLVAERCSEFADEDEYTRRQIEVLLRHDDNSLSALQKLKRANLAPFLRELQRSIGEPCRELVKSSGVLPAYLLRVFHAIDFVLGDIERYSDYEMFATGDMHLSVETDTRVINAYRELLAGIFPQEEINNRVLYVEHQLAQHREELGDSGLDLMSP